MRQAPPPPLKGALTKRVLVLVHFAAKRDGAGFVNIGKAPVAAIQQELMEPTAFLNSNICFGFAGVSRLDVGELHKALSKAIGPRVGDNVSVLELDDNIISTHPGLMEWQAKTVRLSPPEQSSPRK